MTSIVDTQEVSLVAGLKLLHFFLGTRDLHYGQWGDDLEVSIPKLPEAQKRNFDFLIGHIAEGIKPALDVCCGAGGVTLKLLARGYAESFVRFKVYRLLLLRMPEQ
jgi:hypothetical protein